MAYGLEMQIAALDCFLNIIIPKEHLPFWRIIISYIVLLCTVGLIMLIVNYKTILKHLTKKGTVKVNE